MNLLMKSEMDYLHNLKALRDIEVDHLELAIDIQETLESKAITATEKSYLIKLKRQLTYERN